MANSRRATLDFVACHGRTSSDSPVRKPVVPQHERESTALKHSLSLPLRASQARRRSRDRRRTKPDPAVGRATHDEPAAQRFLNKSAPTLSSIEPPPEPSRAWPQARADATPSPRRVAAISTRARAQQRFSGVRALPQKDVQFGARRARGLPQHLVATLLVATRRASDQRLVDADDVRTRASAHGAPFRGRRRGLQGPRELYNQCCYCHRVE